MGLRKLATPPNDLDNILLTKSPYLVLDPNERTLGDITLL